SDTAKNTIVTVIQRMSCITPSESKSVQAQRTSLLHSRETRASFFDNSFGLELDENRHSGAILRVAKIWLKARNNRTGSPGVATWRCNSARAAPIGHIGVAMIELPPEGDVLAWHVVIGCGHIPRLERIAGILGEVRCSRSCGCAVDWRQQHQISPGIVDLSAAQRKAVTIFVEPPAVVEHETEEALLEGHDLSLRILAIARAIHAATALTACVTCKREGHFVQEALRMVVVLHFNAVICVIA